MKLKINSIVFILLTQQVLFSQSPGIEWENTVGGGNFDRFYSVEETPDGGYILGGQSLSGGGVGDKSESNMGGSLRFFC